MMRGDILDIDPWTLCVKRDPEVESPPNKNVRPDVDPNWMRHFKTDQYDFDDPEWRVRIRRGKHAWRMIPLYMRRPGSRSSLDIVPSGYFMAVSPRDYYRMTHHADDSNKHWTLKVDYDPENPERIAKMYARRCGRGDEPRTVYAHREVLRCLHSEKLLGDHFNGWGLDNRRQNLDRVNRRENGSNMVRDRKKHTGLPVGVEIRMRKGEVRYGGVRAKRIKGRKYAVMIRSKRVWKTPGPAHQWYENQIKRLYGGRRAWAHNPRSVSYPFFPPRLEQEPSTRSSRLRAQTRSSKTLHSIPY